ncbi:MAG: protease inhibitor I42 family protein [Snowella sp.]|nr:protease inhibitor I42 family protein [Snowella sp.]
MKDLVKGFVIASAIASVLGGLTLIDPVQNTVVQAETATKLMILTQKENGTTLNLNVGDRFSIQLPENLTTGFQWEFLPNTDGVVSLEETRYITPTTQLIGGGGEILLTFRVEKAGQTTITINHWRPWEGEPSLLERYTLTIQAKS